MLKRVGNTALIARWTLDQDSGLEPPHTVRWADGTPGTHNDYQCHLVDTHTWIVGTHGMELHMFPEIIADVRYDDSTRVWSIGGIGVTPAALHLTDPNTPNDQIEAELYTYPVVYRARIHR